MAIEAKLILATNGLRLQRNIKMMYYELKRKIRKPHPPHLKYFFEYTFRSIL